MRGLHAILSISGSMQKSNSPAFPPLASQCIDVGEVQVLFPQNSYRVVDLVCRARNIRLSLQHSQANKPPQVNLPPPWGSESKHNTVIIGMFCAPVRLLACSPRRTRTISRAGYLRSMVE